MRESYDLLADALGHDAVAEGLLIAADRGVSLVSALVASGVDGVRLASALEGASEPFPPMMRHLRPVIRLVDALPPNLCECLLAVPIGHDHDTGAVEVAVVDGADTHAADEIAYWLGAPVRIVRTPLATMSQALREMASRSGTDGSGAPAREAGEEDRAGESPTSGVPTERGPFEPSAADDPESLADGEEPVPTRRGH